MTGEAAHVKVNTQAYFSNTDNVAKIYHKKSQSTSSNMLSAGFCSQRMTSALQQGRSNLEVDKIVSCLSFEALKIVVLRSLYFEVFQDSQDSSDFILGQEDQAL